VDVLFNKGDGTFTAPVSYVSGAPWEGIAAGDLDQDGRSDLVVGSLYSGIVAVMRGTCLP
jgi:hypothetical protein